MTTRQKLQEIYDKIDWSYRSKSQPGIDFKKLAEDLEKADPYRRHQERVRGSRPSANPGVLASCQACGWISQNADGRTSLEDQVIEDGGEVTFGGGGLNATCPQCSSPLSQEGA